MNAPGGPKHPASTLARHGKLKVTSAAGTLGRFLGLGLVIALISSVIVGGYALLNIGSSLSILDIPGASKRPNQHFNELKGGANLLLLGSDSREGQGAEFGEGVADVEGERNDVTMLLHLSEDHTHATVVSFPRDTIVSRAACTDKDGKAVEPEERVMFNTLLTDGVGCVVNTVEQMSGLAVNYAAVVRFKGVIAMSNAVGGVPVCVAKAIRDKDAGIFLDPGMHTIKGAEALAFLRTRHGVGDGSDLARITNQQVFLSSLFRTMSSAKTLTNPAKLYSMAKAAAENMQLSSSLANLDTMTSIGFAISKVKPANLTFVRLPVAEAPWDVNRVVPEEQQSEVLWARLRADEPVVVKAPVPSASATPSAGTSTSSPAAASPSASPTTPPSVIQGGSGQTADQKTCSNEDE